MGNVVIEPLMRLPEWAWTPAPDDHSQATLVGPWGNRAVCQTCSQVLTPRFDTFTVTDAQGIERTVRGAYVSGPDDPLGHIVPFHREDMGQTQESNDVAETEDTPKARTPVGLTAESRAKARSDRRETPSRSPEARHREYMRWKRRQSRGRL